MRHRKADPYGRRMTETESFQLSLDTARAYEATFVPAIFAEWAPHTVAAAEVTAGQVVVDVACGTGVVARHALEVTGPTGTVIGVDLNDAMLTVAADIEPAIEWRTGDVADLPLEPASADAVTCQMAFMFFPDRVAAFTELGRITRPGGRIAVSVPAALDRQPAYRPFVEAAARHAGPEAVSLLSAYWSCGDLAALAAEAAQGGLAVVDQRTRTGTCGFESPAAFVEIEVKASPLAERVTPEGLEAIITDVTAVLSGGGDDEPFGVPLVGHVLTLAPAS